MRGESTFIQTEENSDMKRRLLLVMLLGLFPCIIFAGHFSAAERTYNVLFIQSYNHRTPWNNKLTEGVRDGLARGGVTIGHLLPSVSLCDAFVNGRVSGIPTLLLQQVTKPSIP